MKTFRERLGATDTALLSSIESQTTDEDKRSLLAVEYAAGEVFGAYGYLEIGSYLGGSLQGFVADERCKQIVSIDPRPMRFPDERGVDCVYVDHSVERMLCLLRQVPGNQLEKLRTIERGTDAIKPDEVGRPNLCFVDGEHTDAAALRDGLFCLDVVSDDGCIFFHDSNIVYRGLRQFLAALDKQGRRYRAYNLPHSLFVVEVGECRMSEVPGIQERLLNNHVGYLWSLEGTDTYRDYYRRKPVKMLKWWDDKCFGLRKRLARLTTRSPG